MRALDYNCLYNNGYTALAMMVH